MRIRVDGDPAVAQDVHWRGIVLTNFDGHRWFTPAHDQRVIPSIGEGEYWLGAADALPSGKFDPLALHGAHGADRHRRNLRRAARRKPCKADSRTKPPAPGALHAAATSVEDMTGSIFNPARNNAKIRYEACLESSVGNASPSCATTRPSIPSRFGARYLQLPPLDPRVKPLADQITAARANAYDKAANIQRYLISHYAYTLDLSGTHGARSARRFSFRPPRRDIANISPPPWPSCCAPKAFPRATSPVFSPANTTTSAATTSSARATRTPGWKSISRLRLDHFRPHSAGKRQDAAGFFAASICIGIRSSSPGANGW